jgi:hypothetical protein
MKNIFKRILKVLGIAILYLPALIFSSIYIAYIISGFIDEWGTKPELRDILGGCLLVCFIYIGIPLIIAFISLCYAFGKKKTWARILKYLHIGNITIFIIIYILAPNNQPTTAQEMEDNYLLHKNDMEALIRYVNSSAKPRTEIKYIRKEITNTDDKNLQTIKRMMEKANVQEINMKTVNADSFLIRSELVYKYYPGRNGGSNYYYNISLNTDKIVDPKECNLISIASIGYNDSVSFADYKAFLGGCHFPDKDEFEKKLATRKKKEEKQIQ